MRGIPPLRFIRTVVMGSYEGKRSVVQSETHAPPKLRVMGARQSDRQRASARLLAICPQISAEELEELVVDICDMNVRLSAFLSVSESES